MQLLHLTLFSLHLALSPPVRSMVLFSHHALGTHTIWRESGNTHLVSLYTRQKNLIFCLRKQNACLEICLLVLKKTSKYMLMFWSFYIQKELSVAFLHGMHVLLEVRNSNYKLETQNVSWELLYIFKDGFIYFLTWTGIGIKMLIFNFGLFSAESL